MQFFFPFQIAAIQALKGRLRRSGASYASSSYSARLANPYYQVKGDYTIVGIGPGISRLDVRNRVYHARLSSHFSGLEPHRDRLSWHRLWGNTYWQGMAFQASLSPKNKHHVNPFKRQGDRDFKTRIRSTCSPFFLFSRQGSGRAASVCLNQVWATLSRWSLSKYTGWKRYLISGKLCNQHQ